MPSTNEVLADRIVKHQVYLQRYSAGTTLRIIGLLNRTDTDLIGKIQDRGTKLLAKGYDPGPETTKRLDVMLGEVRALNKAAYQTVGKELTSQLKSLAEYEADWQGSALESVLPDVVSFRRPPVRLVAAAATARPFQGRLLSEWLDGLEATRSARIRDAIRIGMVQGETIDQMVRRIRGTRALGYADGLLDIDRRGAATIVRTAVNHTANVAREATWADNGDLLKGLQWHSTLDGRTCPVCGALDGKVLQLGKGPRPPEHHGCRCTTIPLLKSWRELGIDIDEMPESTRASMNGQVPESLRYGDWLKKQSAEFQDEVLGKGKAQMFRNGLTIDRFTDRAGNELTLKQLQQAQPPKPPRTAAGMAALPPARGGILKPAQIGAEADGIEYVKVNGARDQIEYAAAYREDGSVALRKAGASSSVNFTPQEVRDLRGTTLIHNHPNGSSLSGADLFFASRSQLREIVAVPTYGDGEFRASPLMSEADIRSAHSAAHNHAWAVVVPAFKTGRITADQANVVHWHIVNAAIDRAGAVAYKSSPTPALQEAIAALGADAFREAVETFKWKP